MRRFAGSVWSRSSVMDAAVPTALLAGHLAIAVADGAVAGWRWPVGMLAVLSAAVALLWRRRAAVAVFAGVLLLDGTAEAVLPESAVAPGLPVAAWIALYSLAVHARGRVALLGAAAATVLVTAPLVRADTLPELMDELLAAALLHLLIVLCGQLRRHQAARRARVAARLAEVDREAHAAAAAERERLAHDLHDAAGHHLSAVAVQSAAALRLVDSRPALADEALADTAATGRRVLTSLADLADVSGADLGGGELHRLVPPLCAGLRRLGWPVTVTVTGRPVALSDETVVAGYRIVQESLTNAMRHAGGTEVTVELRYRPDGLDITVANGCHGTGESAAPGTGRGIAGMRRRVEDVDGRLTAGPEADGGWTVRAALPAERRPLGIPSSGVVTAIVLAAVALPLYPATGLAVGLTVVLAAHAVPLLWWRRAPVAALTGMLAVSLAMASAIGAGLLPHYWLPALAIGGIAEIIGIYGVAAYGPNRLTWLAPMAVGLTAGLAVGLAMIADPYDPTDARAVAVLAVVSLVTGTPWLLPVWAVGLLKRAHRGDGGRWERRATAIIEARTGAAARAERRRIATAVQEVMVSHAITLVRAAESGMTGSGDRAAALTSVAESARRALAGLRELLDMMDDAEAAGVAP